MSRAVDPAEYLDMSMDLLQEGHRDVPVPVSGVSMAPFLHPGDTVYLNLPEKPPGKGDIVLFTRPGGQYVLHRIVGEDSRGCLLLLGDGQMQPEPVPPDKICAIVTSARRSGKPLRQRCPTWWFFRHVWRVLAPVRPQIGRVYGALHRKNQ